MSSEVLFSEKQRFHQWWLWLLLIGVNALILYGIIQQLIFGIPFGDKPASDAGLVLSFLIPLSVLVFFILLRLETYITKEGVYVRFLPFQKTYRHYSWASLSKSFVRKYSPILEYGGWGYRFGMSGKGSALNVSGNKGLQLVTIDGKKMLIGTRKPDEIMQVLRSLGQVKE
jgi:hypothetical protein